MKKKIISVVLPVYNEEGNIATVYDALVQVLRSFGQLYTYEIIFADDGSYDRTWELIKQIAKKDSGVKGVSFSRNFGHQIALRAGYDQACGDVIVSMDADMQHPPELIAQMLEKWESGADIVYAKKINRKDNFLKRTCAKLFYKILDRISDVKIPRDVSDFRLIDKKVLAIICASKEQSPYLRGLAAWTGFKHAFVTCNYYERFSGAPSYTWKKSLHLAWSGITGFSTFPLKISLYIGMLIIFSSTMLGTYFLAAKLFFGVGYGFAMWLATCLLFMIGVQFLVLGVFGLYLGRLCEQQKGRPLYVIEKKITGEKKKEGIS